MIRTNRSFVSALLPILPLAFCQGCGGGSSSDASPQSSAPPPVSSPAVVNQPPTISGQGVASVSVGAIYEWQPVAADAEGDKLSFTAVNLPPWASIDSSDGRITGTPGDSDVGVYESITITVADAAHQAVTQPFSITVTGDVGAGIASLRWDAPASKVDGSPLDDLGGYRILYGRTSEDLDKSVIIDDPATTTYEFTTLPNGIWYFAVVAVSSCGLEGPPTTVYTKSI